MVDEGGCGSTLTFFVYFFLSFFSFLFVFTWKKNRKGWYEGMLE